MQFSPIFLLGALFGKLMEDSGSVSNIASFMTKRLGPRRAVLAVVLAGALVTYGGVSLFVAFFVMAHGLFHSASIPKRLMPAAIALGTPPSQCRRSPELRPSRTQCRCHFLATMPFAAPGLGVIASIIMLGFGLWWLARREAAARNTGESYGAAEVACADSESRGQIIRERATTSGTFDPAEIRHGHQSVATPSIALAVVPLGIMIGANLLMSLFVLPSLDASYLMEEAWGSTSLSAVGGVPQCVRCHRINQAA